MKIIRSIFAFFGSAVLLAACAALPAASTANPPSPAAAAAIRALAQQLKIPESQISVVSVAAQQWPDGCLGLPNPGEMCAMHVVPGYRVILQAGGSQYSFRTDQGGNVVRPEKPALSTPTAQAGAGVSGAILAKIAGQLKVNPGDLRVVKSEAVDWPDACLGAANMGELCAQSITPGFRIVVQVNGNMYEFHTNRDGSSIRPAKPAPFY